VTPPERWEPALPHREPRRRQRNKRLGRARGRPTPAVYGRGSTHRRGAGARHGGVWRRDGGGVGRGLSARRALEEEETGLFHPEVGHRSSRHSVSRGVSLIFSISHLQGGADRPPIAPAKALRAAASVPTRRLSSRAPRAAGSAATATSKGPRSMAAAVEPQQVVAALTAAMTMAVTAPSIPPAPAPVGGSQAAVVEIQDEDTPPPGWDQWGNLPAPAPSPRRGCS
jgi:hypothetical protein